MRYYAQYQHYTFEARKINEVDPDENLNFFIQSIYYVGNAIFSFGKVIGADEKALILVDKVLSSFKDFPGAFNNN